MEGKYGGKLNESRPSLEQSANLDSKILNPSRSKMKLQGTKSDQRMEEYFQWLEKNPTIFCRERYASPQLLIIPSLPPCLTVSRDRK